MKINKKEAFSIKEFMSRPAQTLLKKSPLNPVYSFLPPISIKSLFPLFTDPTFTIFIIGCSLIVFIGVSETLLAKYGFTEIASSMSSTMKVLIPVCAFGLITYFLISL